MQHAIQLGNYYKMVGHQSFIKKALGSLHFLMI
jgi:hypothetical protein